MPYKKVRCHVQRHLEETTSDDNFQVNKVLQIMFSQILWHVLKKEPSGVREGAAKKKEPGKEVERVERF